jgi:hypothetical protein
LLARNRSDDVKNHQSQCLFGFHVPEIARERPGEWGYRLRPLIDQGPTLRTKEVKKHSPDKLCKSSRIKQLRKLGCLIVDSGLILFVWSILSDCPSNFRDSPIERAEIASGNSIFY